MLRHRHLTRKISAANPLAGKKVYIPAMAQGSVEAFASVFRWLGIDAAPTPPSNERTRELGAKNTAGDECYPAKVTVGDFLRIIEQPGAIGALGLLHGEMDGLHHRADGHRLQRPLHLRDEHR